MSPELKEELEQLVNYYRNAYGEPALIVLNSIIKDKLNHATYIA